MLGLGRRIVGLWESREMEWNQWLYNNVYFENIVYCYNLKMLIIIVSYCKKSTSGGKGEASWEFVAPFGIKIKLKLSAIKLGKCFELLVHYQKK